MRDHHRTDLRARALMVHEGNLVRARPGRARRDQSGGADLGHVRDPRSPSARSEEIHGCWCAPSGGEPAQRRGGARIGRITFVDNSVDQATGTIRVKGTFPNTDRRLWPGQYVNVVVTLTTDPNAIVVPSVAVQAGQQGSFVSSSMRSRWSIFVPSRSREPARPRR